jgi:hypothetical protein
VPGREALIARVALASTDALKRPRDVRMSAPYIEPMFFNRRRLSASRITCRLLPSVFSVCFDHFAGGRVRWEKTS